MAEGAHSAWHRPADDGVPHVLAAAAPRPGCLWACWCAPALYSAQKSDGFDLEAARPIVIVRFGCRCALIDGQRIRSHAALPARAIGS